MGKYDQMKYLKKIKARAGHQCSHCGYFIPPGEHYYKEALRDEFLQFPKAKCFCAKCYEQFKESLLTLKSARKKMVQNEKSSKLNEFPKKDYKI